VRRSICLTAALAVALPAGAGAAEHHGSRPYALTVAAGAMTLEFHGDPETGCAERGVCTTSGTVTSTTARAHGNGSIDTFGSTFSGRAASRASGTTSAVVRTAGGPDCTDTVERSAHQLTLLADRTGPLYAGYGPNLSVADDDRTPGAELGWSGPEGQEEHDAVFRTRCAGPLVEDFGMAFARVRLPRGLLRRESLKIGLASTRSFASGGFAGTVTTSLRFTLRRRPCRPRERRYCRAFDAALAKAS
jgi:hypothetical protein